MEKKLRYKDLLPDDRYYQPWSDYRRRHRINNIAFFVALALCAIVLSLNLNNNIKTPIVFLVMASLIVHANVTFYWRCPNCGEPFHMKWLVLSNNFNKCAHCGLRRWAPNGSAAPNQAL